MKTILILITLIMLCAGAQAHDIIDNEHYMIVVLIWDNETRELESGVPVTFGSTHTRYTEEDGSVIYDTANLAGGECVLFVEVSCKYGVKNVPIVYFSDGVQNWGTTVTFNEPDESVVIAILAAMGLAATAIGGGIYLLRRKTNIVYETTDNTNEDETMVEKTEGWKLKNDFGVRALISMIGIAGYVSVVGVAVYQGNAGMIDGISSTLLPIILAIITFYFGGSMIRDGKK